MKSKKYLTKKINSEIEEPKNHNTSELDTSLKISDISFKKGSYNNFKNSLFNKYSEETT